MRTYAAGAAARYASAEDLVVRWVEASNARDLDAMLACLAVGVELQPLRIGSLAARYHGHEGVREWFEQSQRARHEYRIVLAEAHDLGDGRVLASGSLTLIDGTDIGPFSALHETDGECITVVHQYLSEPDMIERLGLLG